MLEAVGKNTASVILKMLIYYDRPCLASKGCDLVLSRMPDMHWFDLLALLPVLIDMCCTCHVILLLTLQKIS